MLENTTIPDSVNNSEDVLVTLGEISEKKKENSSFTCDWDPCSYKSKERPMLMLHIDEHLGRKEKELVIDESTDLETKSSSSSREEEMQTNTINLDEDRDDNDLEDISPEVDSTSLRKAEAIQTHVMCDDCSFTAPSDNSIENHVKQKHGLKELVSCDQCDFDSEDSSKLQEHLTKNIHDINIENRTIQEPVFLQCHKCNHEATDSPKLDLHVINLHGFVRCDKCEYMAEDRDIMKKHKKKHTGTSVFT